MELHSCMPVKCGMEQERGIACLYGKCGMLLWNLDEFFFYCQTGHKVELQFRS
jgi:hypothetical protein